ncbi:hypothetical protein D3C81_1883710 [compost metagenome]
MCVACITTFSSDFSRFGWIYGIFTTHSPVRATISRISMGLLPLFHPISVASAGFMGFLPLIPLFEPPLAHIYGTFTTISPYSRLLGRIYGIFTTYRSP